MTITLPEPLATWVKDRAARLGYPMPDDLVADLLRREIQEVAEPFEVPEEERAELDRLLIEGIESGPAVRGDDAYWAERERVLAERTGRVEKPS